MEAWITDGEAELGMHPAIRATRGAVAFSTQRKVGLRELAWMRQGHRFYEWTNFFGKSRADLASGIQSYDLPKRKCKLNEYCKHGLDSMDNLTMSLGVVCPVRPCGF